MDSINLFPPRAPQPNNLTDESKFLVNKIKKNYSNPNNYFEQLFENDPKLNSNSEFISINKNIKEIKNTLSIHKDDLKEKIPAILKLINQIFKFLLNNIEIKDSNIKETFEETILLSSECLIKFDTLDQVKMMEYVKTKSDYFLNKKGDSLYTNPDPLKLIPIFLDVDNQVKLLLNNRLKPPQPPQRKLNLDSSPIVKSNWEFQGTNKRLVKHLSSFSTSNFDVGLLKSGNILADEAFFQIKSLTKQNMEALNKNLRDQLLLNLEILKDEFDLLDLGVDHNGDPNEKTEKIKELDANTDIRAFVQERIDLLTELPESS